MSYEVNENEYSEEFILKAAVISHARSRSLKEVATLLCVPPEMLEKWKDYYSKKIKVQYLPNKFIRHREPVFLFFPVQNYKKVNKSILDICPECDSQVVFDSIKRFPVQQAQSAEIAGQHSLSKAGGGGFPVKISFRDVTTERIERCPECGLYVIRYVTERLANSEV